jgi:acetolactate synthase-1/2/3 large subunit
VRGESYLATLNGLHESGISTIAGHQEGGVAMIAEAHGKLTEQPGIAFVTRGPGATNASAGVHIAQQDSTPMILFIGQVASDQLDREAFQEVDYRQMFGPLAKWIAEIDRTDRIPEYVSRAFHIAQSGRPGPVVLALPEDKLSAFAETDDVATAKRVSMAPDAAAINHIVELLGDAKRPPVIVGGSGWSAETASDLNAFAANFKLPVGASFPCQDYLDNRVPSYVGDVGIGINPKLAKRVREADLLLVLGARLGEMTTSGYTLLSPPAPKQKLIHVHPDPSEIGRVYRPDFGLAACAAEVVKQLASAMPPSVTNWCEATIEARRDYEAWQELEDAPDSAVLGACGSSHTCRCWR